MNISNGCGGGSQIYIMHMCVCVCVCVCVYIYIYINTYIMQLEAAEEAIKEIVNDTPLPDPRALSKQVKKIN